jgi:hypothetical protein
MRVVHILGLAHSGTTITDRILSCFPGTIGLGEIERVWQEGSTPDTNRICPCGQPVDRCPFWGKVLNRTYGSNPAFVRAVAEEAKRQGYACMTDTSKAMRGTSVYGEMVGEGAIESITMLRIIRDPRGWVYSMMRRNGVAADDIEGIKQLFDRWLISSLLLDHRIRRPGLKRLYVWYDKIVMEGQEAELAARVALPALGGDVDLNKSNQHAIAGNKFQSLGRSRLRYDSGWLGLGVLDDLYAGLTSLRRYYQQLQTLHLTDTGYIAGLPKTAMLREQSKALAAGKPSSTFAELHTSLSVSAAHE